MPVAAVKAALIASMPAFSPGSEWLLPTVNDPAAALGPVPVEAGGFDVAGWEAPPPVLGALLAAGEHAAMRLGPAARPATPAIPPRTRRRVMIGLLGVGSAGERGSAGFAM